MARTKQEIRNWLEDKASGNKQVADLSNAILNGQCVALIKGLMDFLGVPNPYGARGNAKDAGDAYIRQGIGTSGRGWLTVAINRNMGGGYGHIWVDLLNEANYEQNGAIALHTTKNTRPINQAQQFINFDQWIKEDGDMPIPNADNYYGRYRVAMQRLRGRDMGREEFNNNFVGRTDLQMLEAMMDDQESVNWYQMGVTGRMATNDNWPGQIQGLTAELNTVRQENSEDDAKILQLSQELELAKNQPPQIIEKPVEVIKEVVKGDEDRTFGDLLSAAFKKLLGQK